MDHGMDTRIIDLKFMYCQEMANKAYDAIYGDIDIRIYKYFTIFHFGFLRGSIVSTKI